MNKPEKALKTAGITLGALIGTILLSVVILYNAISSEVGARKIGEIASGYIDGEVSIKDIDIKLFTTFPHLYVKLDSVQLLSEVIAPQDTLARFSRLEASINLINLLTADKVNVDSLMLYDPAISVHIDRQGKANFQIYQSREKQDTAKTAIPGIWLKKLLISNARLSLKDDRTGRKAHIGSLTVKAKGKYADDITATLDMKTPGVCYSDPAVEARDIPLGIEADMKIDTTITAFDINALTVALDDATVRLKGKIKSDRQYGQFSTDLLAGIDIPDIEHLRRLTPKPYDKYVDKFTTGGAMAVTATVKGLYNPAGTDSHSPVLPMIAGKVDIDRIWMEFKGRQGRVSAGMSGELCLNFQDKDNSYLNVNVLNISAGKSYLNTKAKVSRLLGDNPYVRANVTTALKLDSMAAMLPDVKDLKYSGDIKATAEAKFKLKDIQKLKLQQVYAKSNINISRIKVNMPSQGIRTFGKNFTLQTGINSIKSKRSKKLRFFVTRLDVDTMLFNYGKKIRMGAKEVKTSLTADSVDNAMPFLRGSATMSGIKTFMDDTTAVVGNKTRISLTMKRSKKDSKVPELTARLNMDSMMYFTPGNAMMTDSFSLKFTAMPRARKFRRLNGQRIRIDENERKEMGMDSLMRLVGCIQKAGDPMDEALKKLKFNGNSKIRLARMSSPYFPLRTTLRKLDLAFTDDTITLKKARVRIGKSTVNLKGEIQNFRRYLRRGRTLTANLDVTGRRINFNEILNASYQGKLTKERRAKLEKAVAYGYIKPFRPTGDRLIRPQVFERGWQQKFEKRRQERMTSVEGRARKAKMDSLMEKVSTQMTLDSIQMARSAAQTDNDDEGTDTTATFQLLCLPDNLNINFNARIDTARFANVILNDFHGAVKMKNSTLKLEDLTTKTNIGNLKLNGMYHCNNVNGAHVGIDVQGSDVDITNLVNTMPEIDNLVPMLRSFQGIVTVDLTAQAEMDSTYNLLLPSLKAATVIRGDSLVLMDGETFTEVAKMLMFKKKTKNLIDNISVELLLDNNEMKVLPFMVELDKYKVAVGGQNSLDMKFNYHVSVLKTPIPLLKLGVNVSGTIEDMKIRPALPKYKDDKTVTRKDQFSNGGVNLRSELQTRLREAIKNSLNAYVDEKKKLNE